MTELVEIAMCVRVVSFFFCLFVFLLFHVVDDMVYHGTRLGYSTASCTKGKEEKKEMLGYPFSDVVA